VSLPRCRFTLGQLIKAIAALAVVLAVIRTPFWPFLPAIGIVLAGFTIDRAGGGTGIGGATMAGFASFVAFGLVILPLVDRSIASELGVPGIAIISLGFLSPMGVVFGFVIGFAAFWVLYVRDAIRQTGTPARSVDCAEVGRGFEDDGLLLPQAGGRQP
jgi:hypothetical protein